jgi:hypothetical protein
LGTVGGGWTKSYALLITVIEKLDGFRTPHELIRSAVEAERSSALHRDVRVFGSAGAALVINLKSHL